MENLTEKNQTSLKNQKAIQITRFIQDLSLIQDEIVKSQELDIIQRINEINDLNHTTFSHSPIFELSSIEPVNESLDESFEQIDVEPRPAKVFKLFQENGLENTEGMLLSVKIQV